MRWSSLAWRWLFSLMLCGVAGSACGQSGPGTYGDQGAAYAACTGWASSQVAASPTLRRSPSCQASSGGAKSYKAGWEQRASTSAAWNAWDAFGTFSYTGGACSARSSVTTQFLPLTGSTQCWDGCEMTYRQNADDETSTRSPTGSVCGVDYKNTCPTGKFWNGYMGVCQPIEPDCPEGQSRVGGLCKTDNQCPDGMVAVQGSTPGAVAQGSLYCAPSENECPAGNVMSPGGQCLPGEGQCAQGEAKGKDGTCKRDANNDGKPDEEEGEDDPNKDSASGGDNCNAPPSCNGNAIQCAQLRVQWRIDCNTRRQVNIAGGTCDAVPVCTGDGCNAMEYAQLLQQWRTTCAVEKLARSGSTTPGTNVGDANGNGVADVLEGSGEVTEPGDGTAEVGEVRRFGINVSTDLLDSENIFGGGSCPQFPSFQLMGVSISGADFPYFCQLAAILRALILMWGAYTALRILMGWGF